MVDMKLQDEVKQVAQRLPKKAKDKADMVSCEVVTLLLYQVSEEYNTTSVLDEIVKVCTEKEYSYAYILHDKDVYKEDTYDKMGHLLGKKDEVKKPHYHIAIRFTSRRNIGDIALLFGIPSKFIQVVKPRSWDSMLLYLTHRKDEDKFQYNKDLVQSNIKPYCDMLYETYKPKTNLFAYVFGYLDGVGNKYCYFRNLFEYLLDECEVNPDDYRYYYNVLKDIIKEHNEMVASRSIADGSLTMERNEMKQRERDIKKLVDTFGCQSVEIDGDKYIITRVNNKKKGGNK